MRLRLGIERFDPSKDSEPWIEWYDVEIDERSTLLDALLKVEAINPSISIPYSCRRGVCGSCVVEVNGVALPACSTPVSRIVECLGTTIIVKPLSILPRTRDLVVDRSRVVNYIDRYRYWIHRLEPYIPPERIDPSTARRVQELRRCSLCLACMGTCPVRRLNTAFGGLLGFRIVAERLCDPRDAMDRIAMAVNDGLYACLMCDACTSVCPQDIDGHGTVLKLREHAWRKGLVPIKVRDAVEAVLDEEYGNPLWMPRSERGSWLEGLAPSSTGEVLIFAGCMASYVDKGSVVALAKIMQILGIRYVALGSQEQCCGMPVLLAGNIDEAKRIAERNAAMFKRLGVKTVVTPCPSCYHMFKTLYPMMGVDLGDIDVLHSSMLLAEAIDKGLLKPRRKLDIVATYHDPCDLGRHEGVFEEPRRVIERVVERFVEMRRRKWYAQCCGAGGNVRIADPELSLRIGMDRLRKDLPSEAVIVVHACPTCLVQLEEASQRMGLSVEHISLQELVLRAIQC